MSGPKMNTETQANFKTCVTKRKKKERKKPINKVHCHQNLILINKRLLLILSRSSRCPSCSLQSPGLRCADPIHPVSHSNSIFAFLLYYYDWSTSSSRQESEYHHQLRAAMLPVKGLIFTRADPEFDRLINNIQSVQNPSATFILGT